jgi:hypothetical protein
MVVEVVGGTTMPLRHHSLIAWQRADDLFIKLHRLTLQSFPGYERFELGSQLRREAYSVPANIVVLFGPLTSCRPRCRYSEARSQAGLS